MPLYNGKHRDGDSMAQQQHQQPVKLTQRRGNSNTAKVGQHHETSACENDRVIGVNERTSVAVANGHNDDVTDVGKSVLYKRDVSTELNQKFNSYKVIQII